MPIKIIPRGGWGKDVLEAREAFHNQGIRQCSYCARTFPASKQYFHADKNSRHGLNTYCKTCAKVSLRSWRIENRDEYLAQQRDRRSVSLYGMTRAEVLEKVVRQGGCAVCGSDDPGSPYGWHVDHCHKTGVVRGVLCYRCNTRLVPAAEDPLLQKAIEYVKSFE